MNKEDIKIGTMSVMCDVLILVYLFYVCILLNITIAL